VNIHNKDQFAEAFNNLDATNEPAQQGSVPDGWRLTHIDDPETDGYIIRGPGISYCAWKDKEPWLYLFCEALATTPQPEGQQGSVPEGWRECLQEMVQAMHDYEMSVDEDAPYKHRAMMDRAYALLSTTPQPEGDGWVKCSERLPTEADEDPFGMVHFMRTLDDSPRLVYAEQIGAEGPLGHRIYQDSCWKPTGLTRPQPPKSKEGES